MARKKKKTLSPLSCIMLILLIVFVVMYIYVKVGDINFNKEHKLDKNEINTPIDNTEKPTQDKENNKEQEEKKEEQPKEEEKKEETMDEISEIKYDKPLYLNKVYNNSGTTIKDGWEHIITSYLDLYYKSLINLKAENIANLFTDSNSNEAYLTQKATEFIVEHRKLQTNDMSLTNAKYDINYQSVKINGNVVTIKFYKNDYLNFKYLKGIETKAYDMENTITFRRVGNDYTIDSIRVIQDYYIMFSNEVNTSNSNAKSKIDSLTSTYLDKAKKEVENNKTLITSAKDYKASLSFDHAYDRKKAMDYAKEYVSKRNKEFTSYDSSGGNCMNFASQAINAGGVPMDHNGEYQWKHYSSTLDSSNEAKGRSASWISTNAFYEYAKNNTGFGLVSEVNVNIFAAEPGDIIQVGYDGYSHTAIVVDTVKNSKGETMDVLINCNTLSLENYPLLGYGYPNKRLIKILGYND